MKYNDIPQIRIFRNFLRYQPEYQVTLEIIAQDLCDTSRGLLMPSNRDCATLLLHSLIIDDHGRYKGHSDVTRGLWHKLVHRDTHGERPTEEDKARAREILSLLAHTPPPAFLHDAFERKAAKTARDIAQGLNDHNSAKILDLVAAKYLVPVADIVNEATIVALQDKEYVEEMRDTAIFTAHRELNENEITRACHHLVTSEMNEALAHRVSDLIEVKFKQLRTSNRQKPDDDQGPPGPALPSV